MHQEAKEIKQLTQAANGSLSLNILEEAASVEAVPDATEWDNSSVALKHARNGHALCNTKHYTALAQQSLSKTSVGVLSLPFPPSACSSVVVSAPVTYAVNGAVRTLPSVSLEERSFSRGLSPTSLAVSSSTSSSVSSSVSPSMCLTF